jgi:hypothetical protein
MNSFLFLIPLTPDKYLTKERYILRNMSLTMLKSQNYKNWNALLVGNTAKYDVNDNRFIKINYEGIKEEKIQVAVNHIIEHKLNHEFLIRLDDDDFFNPEILISLKNQSFDAMVDKYQTFWFYQSNLFSNRVWFWYPNTIIQKRDHALSKYGFLSNKKIKKINRYVSLIENNHSQIHNYYRGKNIKIAKKSSPIYIRTISNNSITSNNNDLIDYINSFGVWKKKKYTSYPKLTGNNKLPIKQNLYFKFKVNINFLLSRFRYSSKI